MEDAFGALKAVNEVAIKADFAKVNDGLARLVAHRRQHQRPCGAQYQSGSFGRYGVRLARHGGMWCECGDAQGAEHEYQRY